MCYLVRLLGSVAMLQTEQEVLGPIPGSAIGLQRVILEGLDVGLGAERPMMIYALETRAEMSKQKRSWKQMR